MNTLLSLVCLSLVGPAPDKSEIPSPRESGFLYDSDVMMNALVAEMDRAMADLRIEGLSSPYQMRLGAEERLTYRMQAANGAILQSRSSHEREASSRVRVGNFDLDNTNMGFRFGGRTSLPLEDNEYALRHSLWQMIDRDYKRAVELMARKQAFLAQKNVIDRPKDYAPREGDVAIEPSPEIVLKPSEWEDHLREISACFSRHPMIQDSSVALYGGAINQWLVDSEGTRIRMGDTGAVLSVRAEIQAEEGMVLRDGLRYIAEQPADLPPVEEIVKDIDKLCYSLQSLARAEILEEYTGPVLFDAEAAGRVFGSVLAPRLCARPIPLGRGGGGDPSLAKKIGRRILPRSFVVYDNPVDERFEGTLLAGSYRYDDEGVVPTRVSLVENGILKTLLAGRAPTRKVTGTTGHARQAGFSEPTAHIGCLYIEDTAGLSDEAMKAALIQAAKDEGLEYGVRVHSMKAGRGGNLGDPIVAYKVDVADGKETLIRGMEFGTMDARELKRMLAAGKNRAVYNQTSGIGSSIVCPSILVEELEITKIEREFDRLPILDSPDTREP